MQKMLYVNWRVTTNQKNSNRYVKNKKNKESKYITKENQQTMEEGKRRKGQRRSYKKQGCLDGSVG